MKGYIANIEEATKDNNNFRKVLYTGKNSQLVVMSIDPGQDIGEEVHDLDQFIRIEKGKGLAVIDGIEHELEDDFAVIIPAGARHNVINTSESEMMKLYTVYSPPEHKDAVIHETKEDAMNSENDHFDGKTTETP